MKVSQSSIGPSQLKQLTMLEGLLHRQQLTTETLSDLVTWYVRLVDASPPPLRSYFLDRMSFVLSLPQITSLLSGPAQFLRQTVISTYEDGEPIKAQKIEMQMKILREVESQKKAIRKKVQQAEGIFEQHDAKLHEMCHQQDVNLMERRQKRKQNKLKRKKSEGNIDIDPSDILPKQEVTQDLKKAQQELNVCVERFTRMTARKEERNTSKGRVRQRVVKKQEEIIQEEESVQEHNHQNESKKGQAALKSGEEINQQLQPEKQQQSQKEAHLTVAPSLKRVTTRATRYYEPINDDEAF